MKKEIVTLTVVLTLGVAGFVYAEEMKTPDMGTAPQAAGQMMAADADDMAADSGTTMEQATGEMAEVEVNNKFCPIDMKEIGSMGEPANLSYNGKIYKVCCPACIEEFNKNKDQYIENFAKVEPAAETMEKAGEMAGEMKDMAAGVKEETKPMAQ